MKIDTTNTSILELFPIKIEKDTLKVSLKNGSTLTLKPVVRENNEVSYDIDYLTGKENKHIEKLQNKIRELQEQVTNIKENNVENCQHEEENEIIIQPTSEEQSEAE